jgi:hypothetical protein
LTSIGRAGYTGAADFYCAPGGHPMPDLDRADLLDLLGQLGAPDDASALAAARALHGKVSEAGLTWDTLLRLDADASRHEQDDSPPDATSADAPSARHSGGKAEVALLIERLLARASISDALREELVDFKRAIADGSFDEMDAQYVRALAKRLRA